MMPHARTRPRKGAVVVLAAFMMVVIFAFVAFSVDIGYIVDARTELQRTADACAMAAVMQLPNEANALATAQQVALDNTGMVGPPLEVADVEFGAWDRDTAKFISPPPSAWRPSAVRVTLKRTAARGNPLSLFFAPVIGTSFADAEASAIAMVDQSLCGPFVGIEWLSVPGSPQTDSFNSDDGPYNSATGGDRGSLCSDGPIDIDGNPYVRGDATAGKGHRVTLTGNPTVTGHLGSRLKPLNMPPVDASEAATSNDNHSIPMVPEGNGWKSVVDANGNFLLDGQKTLDLPGGTYYLNDFILKGGATLNITGPVKVYLTGDLERAGSATVNFNTGQASALEVYMTGGTAHITSSNDYYGVIYAPNTDVTVDGSAQIFGAVVGKTLTLTGSNFAHYDEALGLGEVSLPKRSAVVW